LRRQARRELLNATLSKFTMSNKQQFKHWRVTI
jgi:hypothetical protein